MEPFDVISENSSPKGFFWPNKKKSVILLLSADSQYFRTYALNCLHKIAMSLNYIASKSMFGIILFDMVLLLVCSSLKVWRCV